MEHFFELPVLYKNKELTLKGRLVTFAYSYKFFIIAEGKELVFERDEDQHFRVLSGTPGPGPESDPELIQAIIEVLEKVQST